MRSRQHADGSCLARVSRLGQDNQVTDAPVRVHHWTAGAPVSPGPVDVATARWAGQVLAILHGLRITPIPAQAAAASRVRDLDAPVGPG